MQFCLGKVSVPKEFDIKTGALTELPGGEFLLDVEDIARFLVIDKDKVIIEPYAGALEANIRLYLLSSIIGILMHKRAILALHASSVIINGGAILFSGRSGIGKSTIALGLHRRGHEILNDDISSIFFDENKTPHVYPGYIHLKLWKESIESYGLDPDAYRRLRKERDKFSFPLKREQSQQTFPVKAIVFLCTTDGPEIKQEPINGIEAFEFLRANTFRYQYTRPLKTREMHFAQCVAIAQEIPIIKIGRPHSLEPHEFAGFIEQTMTTL